MFSKQCLVSGPLFFSLSCVLQIRVLMYSVVVFFARNHSMVTVENDSPFLNLQRPCEKTAGYIFNTFLELSSRMAC